MKTKKDVTKARNQYSPEFKKQALERAEKDGVAATARDLNLNEGQIYAWRQKRRLEGLTGEDQKLQPGELARLKRDLARLEEENTFLKTCRGQILPFAFPARAMIRLTRE